MRSTLSIFAAISAMATAATAAAGDQSAPFNLKLSSADAALDGSYLYSCHSGAAIEQLCIGNKTTEGLRFPGYYLNHTTTNDVKGFEAGILTWNMPFGGSSGDYVNEPLTMYQQASSNVAVLVFRPAYASDGVNVGFDADNKLFLYTYVDDTVTPPVATGEPFLFYNWNVCQTYYSGYRYFALAWVTAGTPVNPSCKAVSVIREFI